MKNNKNIVIIGYGNSLRSDDGVGRQVADLVEEQQWHNVRVFSVHQLTPELAAEIPEASAVIFVDAVASEGENIEVIALEPEAIGGDLGHTGNPQSLLALTQLIYGNIPSAWWILIPGKNFEFGEQLSSVTQECLFLAFQEIERLVKLATRTNK